jgi:DNA-binding LytR/AlgR family response regulator
MKKKIPIGARRSVFLTEIKYFEAHDNYTMAHFTSGEKLLVATTLKKIQVRCCTEPNSLFRASRKVLLNLSYATYCPNSESFKIKESKEFIKISRRRRPLNPLKPQLPIARSN